MASVPPAGDPRLIDPQVWKACAGAAVRIPTVGSRVYYFPQGHAEQASSTPDFSSVPNRKPYVHCRLLSVSYLADRATDEVFTKFGLRPCLRQEGRPDPSEPLSPEVLDEDRVMAFSKTLTPSDANNGGGFSVPRHCADTILPPLDFDIEPPLQNIMVTDMHGTVWKFRHIYRGTPRRHLLTTGWSKFVNNKKLIAGDSVIFIRNRAGELFVGIRRARQICINTSDYSRYAPRNPPPIEAGAKREEKVGDGEGFSRNVKGRVPAESVVEAVSMSTNFHEFEVIYYPRAGSSDFVVGADIMEASVEKLWAAGMQVRMSVETEDSSRMTWIQGTLSGIAVVDTGLWPASPWRMLQVTWNDPETLQNVRTVNPWQVDLVSGNPHLQPYPNIRKLEVPPQSEPNVGEGNMYFPKTGFDSRVTGNTPSLLNQSTFPAGMQGARHDSSCESSYINFFCRDSLQLPSINLNGNEVTKQLTVVPTEVSAGSMSQSEGPSRHGQGNTIQNFGIEISGTAVGNPTRTVRRSIQLFGQIIQTKQPCDAAYAKEHKEVEADSDKGHKEVDANYDKEHKEVEVQSADFSFPSHKKRLLNSRDVQRQRSSAFEALYLDEKLALYQTHLL